MSAAEKIPEEVRRVAAQMVCDIPGGTLVADVRFLTKFAARAIMAERERCKRIARNYPCDAIFGSHKNHAVAFNASQNIADMIDGRLATAIRGEG